MISIGLDSNGLKKFKALIRTHHSVYARVQLLDLDHNPITDISSMLLSGQVTIDSTAEIDRAFDGVFLDPGHKLHIDSDSPHDGVLFYDRMLRVIYVVMSPDKKTSFSVPVFTGPISKFDRTDAAISVAAVGKEVFGLMPNWKAKTYKKGMNKIDVIESIIYDLMGEGKKINQQAGSRGKIPRNINIGLDDYPWQVAKRLAAGIDMHLFYDGRGVPVLRKFPSKTSFEFTGDVPGANILTKPQAGFGSEIVNAVEVKGRKPKGKKRVRARKVAPRSHPLSPWRLGRKNAPRYFPMAIEDDGIKSVKEAKRVAARVLSRYMKQTAEVTFDALPWPMGEPEDEIRIKTEDYGGTIRLKKMTIPLVPAPASIGYVRNVKKPNRKAIRSRKKRR